MGPYHIRRGDFAPQTKASISHLWLAVTKSWKIFAYPTKITTRSWRISWQGWLLSAPSHRLSTTQTNPRCSLCKELSPICSCGFRWPLNIDINCGGASLYPPLRVHISLCRPVLKVSIAQMCQRWEKRFANPSPHAPFAQSTEVKLDLST